MAFTQQENAACGRCQFFDQSGGTAKGGLCRYNPPIALDDNAREAVWPPVAQNDWCGHFEPARETA